MRRPCRAPKRKTRREWWYTSSSVVSRTSSVASTASLVSGTRTPAVVDGSAAMVSPSFLYD